MQHRSISAGLNILLTDWGNLFTRDFFIPTGDLRDIRENYKRAHIIIVTKCAAGLTGEERARIEKEINPLPHQKVFFTTIVYGTPYHILNHRQRQLDNSTEVLLVTGIANPKPLKKYLEEAAPAYYMIHYGDHHIFTIDDWKDIRKRFEAIQVDNKVMLTTEKDAMRLLKFEAELVNLPFYVMPIEHKFLFGEGTMFDTLATDFITNFKRPVQDEQEG
jgi:tetraacyldisaccharide 4'-kinase